MSFQMRNIKKLWMLVLVPASLFLLTCTQPAPIRTARVNDAFSKEELRHRTFNYFWERADSTNYQIPDRWPGGSFSSIAATGFGLSSYLVGIERGYITRAEGAARTLRTLEILTNLSKGEATTGVAGYKGFFYHFLTYDTATRFKQVELSTIDTALLMAGILSSMSYFDRDGETETRIRELADALYRAVEWDWALNDDGRISMGWHPESGFIPYDWNGYNEAMILLVLALGSPTHPVPNGSWEKWTEGYDYATYNGQEHLHFAPLFGHQYSHLYIDFRNIQDDYMRARNSNYFENSRLATLANRNYCIENPHGYRDYGPKIWGLTACDGPATGETGDYTHEERPFRGYSARGPANQPHSFDDGTIAPTAAGGSIMFTPEESLTALEHMWNIYGSDLVGEYGFRDAFNPTYRKGPGNEHGWFDSDYLGIDQGPILLSLENHESGLIWHLMMQNPYVRRGLERAGFRDRS